MKIVVWDGVHHGHHPQWMPRVVEALRSRAEVVVAMPQALADAVGDLGTEVEILPPDADRSDVQLDLLPDVLRRHRPDHLLHLYGVKGLLREWLRRPPLGVPSTLMVNHPAALHYPRAYRTRLTPPEYGNAIYKEALVWRWRQRADAHAVFALDPGAVGRWQRQRGAPAYELPEPPVEVPPGGVGGGPAESRGGVLLFGALTRKKGIDLLTRALTLEPTELALTIAGSAEPTIVPDIEGWARELRAAGIDLTLDVRRIETAEAMVLMARARCIAMPYRKQPGTSRTLVEAATAGTPVVVHDYGLLGHLVRTGGLGEVVDCRDPRALRRAILALDDPCALARYEEPLRRFADRFAPDRFAAALFAPFA